jgi:hypothetical protein
MKSLSIDALGFGRTVGKALFAGVIGAAMLACGDSNDNDPVTVALGDSGNVSTVASSFAIPTTVAIRDDVAWVAESQFDHYEPFGGDNLPGSFRILGIPLAGGAPLEVALPDGFFPEGIAVTEAGRLYVGSVANRSIWTLGPSDSEMRPYVPAGTLGGSVLGLAADLERELVWACVTNFSSSLLVGIGMGDAQVKVEHPLAGGANDSGALCNDIIVAPNGNLWITESFGGRLFQILSANVLTPNSAQVWLEADDLAPLGGPQAGEFGVNGLELMSGRLYLVNAQRGTLLSIDPTLTSPSRSDLQLVTLSEAGVPGGLTLANPDGLARVSDTQLLIVENGLNLPGGKRLVRVRFDTL